MGAGRAHAAGQGDRPRRHCGGQPPLPGGGAFGGSAPDRLGATSRIALEIGTAFTYGSAAGRFPGFFERVFNTLSEEFDLECVFVDGTVVQAHPAH